MVLTNPNNPPVSEGGVYLITNTITREHYVGTTSNLLNRYHGGYYFASADRLAKAIEQYGDSAFIYQPIYLCNDTPSRVIAETALIHDYDCINNGYNTVSSYDHTKGSTWITNGIVMRRIADDQPIPDGFVIGRGQRGKEIGARGGAASLGKRWITNGITSRKIPSDQPIPKGWHRGKMDKRSR